MPDKPVNSEADSSPLAFMSKLAPAAFTVPILGLKSFIPSLAGLFVLGCIFAIGMYFYGPRLGITSRFQRFGLVVVCFAWLLIIDEVGANELFNKYILDNAVDDHTTQIRFFAGFLVVLVTVIGFQSKPKEDDSTSVPKSAGKPAV